MQEITLIAICTFGLEAVVKREVKALGFDRLKTSEGKVEFQARVDDIPKANLWLRSADRVLLKMGEFRAMTFDELFEGTKALPWGDWITEDGVFTVTGSSHKSTLGSVRACQAIVKKAVVENLKAKYHIDWFEENGPEFTIKVAMRKDVALLTIDTSGSGLNRRGYRIHSGEAALKETMASALVQLSFWREDRLLIDPFCGSGTILIEAAMLARNMAPGLNRNFASEDWPSVHPKAWKAARRKARLAEKPPRGMQIFGYDIDDEMVDASQRNAKKAGVGDDITFEQKDVKELWIDKPYGILISNPPYGVKLGVFQELNQIYISLHKTFRKKKGWSIYMLTADKKFPDYFKRAKPDRVRKLFNGPLEVNYYQYYGERPPRE
ncbi:MAG: class I SAM-dependent RNA methyltransferase [Chloroflexi bacterium]|nr:class I SAM-dependent RNA methyltransferase [Chloroflexota bacterium]